MKRIHGGPNLPWTGSIVSRILKAFTAAFGSNLSVSPAGTAGTDGEILMARSAKLLSGLACFGAVAIVAATGLAIPQAQAFPMRPNYVVGYTPGSHNLDFSNSNATGNIAMGGDGGFVGSGSGTITGTVEFAAANSGQYMPDGITVTGGATFGNTNVQSDFNALYALSQSLSNEVGTPQFIAAGGSVNASNGVLDSNGNEVFTATINSNFTAGTTFTINGTSSQFVVFNTTTGGLPFDGSIVLTGGITSDHVLFNFDAGNYETLSGGDPLMINTDFNTTTGTYLDPNGIFQVTDTMLDGRIFGGDSMDSSITGSTIVAPASPVSPASEPTSLALLGAGLVALGFIRRRHHPLLARS
jgi:MYXO-CTERM domain-containing protein